MNEKEKVLKTIFALGGKISEDGNVQMSCEQWSELKRIMKDEYGIEIHPKQSDESERLRTAMHEYVLSAPPVLECGPYLDGKAKRRKRRKQERMKLKKKTL